MINYDNGNRLFWLIPTSLANMNLALLDLNNNMFMGSIPKFKSVNVTYASNSFCQSNPGEQCAPEVTALLDFLRDLDYPERLASEWTGNDPCGGPWWGISCNSRNEVIIINLQRLGLNGTLSPSLVNLSALLEIHLEGNNVHGKVPANLTQLRSLRLVNISGNDFEPPLPRFRVGVKVVTDGNVKFRVIRPKHSPSPASSPVLPPSPNVISPESPSNSSTKAHQPSDLSPNSPTPPTDEQQNPTKPRVLIIAAAAGSTAFTFLAAVLAVYCLKKRKKKKNPPASLVIHPKDSSDPSNMFKIAMINGSASWAQTGSSTKSTDGFKNPQMIDSGNLLVSLQVLRKVTNNFAQENELGRGGFGVVYKGELEDGMNIAVKRMVVGAVSSKALDEFQSEISVLSKVRHRHLVSLLGYSDEGYERLLVYEYMPQGALSIHLF